MKKNLSVLSILLVLLLSFATGVFAATLDDIPDNTLRLGNDFYDFSSAYFSDTDCILSSLSSGADIYVKLGGYWYDLTRLTDAEIMNPEFAEAEEDLNTWTDLDSWYGSGSTVETMTNEIVPTGTYSIIAFNAFTNSFTVTVNNLENAAYFNVYNDDTILSNNPVSIGEGLVNVSSVFTDTAALSVKVYSDAEGMNEVATASLDGNANLCITVPEPPTGTYSITVFNDFSDSFSVSVNNLEGAAYFNVYNGEAVLSNSPVSVDQGLVNVSSMFNDISILRVVFYSDADGSSEVAAATLDSNGNLVF